MGQLAILAISICLAAAAGLSLVIRSREHGIGIMMFFALPALVGLLMLNGRAGAYLAFGAGAGVIGCAAAIGTFRFWSHGSPVARSAVSVAVLIVVASVSSILVFLRIPT
jgi:hypothetical protein